MRVLTSLIAWTVWFFAQAVGVSAVGADVKPLPSAAPLKLVYASTDAGALETSRWVFSDPTAWRVLKENDTSSLELTNQSNYKPLVRSPFNIALLSNLAVGSFTLEAELLQTSREYGHRDLCVFFGFKSPTEFYYLHLATAADNNAHNIFLVNKKPRAPIATETTKGVEWGQNIWHKVRIERRIEDGSVAVFFDDMKKPIMKARDQTFTKGLVGFGSFDDTGRFRNIRLYADKTDKARISFSASP
jgi:hypothetical protein